jgi:hypothetical protein
MATVEGGMMPCWLAVGLALGTAAVAGAGCAGTLGAGCVGGVLAGAYAYDTAVQACS